MAKISPVSIKYNITADFNSEGPVEKPDVIGALFGQTEGLLGHEMELRQLQQEGKIGRIDVELATEGGKTKGEIVIPSALDKTTTALIAAAIETIDKIGPTDAKITIREIEDVRGNKRDYIMDRAKKLLAGIKGMDLESQEMSQEIIDSSRTSKIQEYGEERLPAGDLTEKEIIVVEGRADVVNLLKHGIKNVIGMNGTRLPAEIAKLGMEKELILFVDGDRGGKLIAKNVCDNAKVLYIASAPDGKEVEELSGKEILMALRKKTTTSDFFRNADREERYSGNGGGYRDDRYGRNDGYRNDHYGRNDGYRNDRYGRDDRFGRNDFRQDRFRDDRFRDNKPQEQREDLKVESIEKPKEVIAETVARELTKEDKDKLKVLLKDLGAKSVIVLNDKLETLSEVSTQKLDYLKVDNAFIMLANSATNKVVEAAESLKANYLAAKTFGKVETENVKVKLVSL